MNRDNPNLLTIRVKDLIPGDIIIHRRNILQTKIDKPGLFLGFKTTNFFLLSWKSRVDAIIFNGEIITIPKTNQILNILR